MTEGAHFRKGVHLHTSSSAHCLRNPHLNLPSSCARGERTTAMVPELHPVMSNSSDQPREVSAVFLLRRCFLQRAALEQCARHSPETQTRPIHSAPQPDSNSSSSIDLPNLSTVGSFAHVLLSCAPWCEVGCVHDLHL